jgi:hypothetical protein
MLLAAIKEPFTISMAGFINTITTDKEMFKAKFYFEVHCCVYALLVFAHNAILPPFLSFHFHRSQGRKSETDS